MTETDPSLERLLFNLNTLTELGEEITSPRDFSRVVKSSLLMVMGSFSASRGVIYMHDRDRSAFMPIASKGLSGADEMPVALGREAERELVGNVRPIDLKNGEEPFPFDAAVMERLENLGARLLALLVVKDELLGAIAISAKLSGEGYSEYDRQLLSVMAQNIAFSIHSHQILSRLTHKYNENKYLCTSLARIYYDTIHAFAAAIDAKDAYTKGHSHRVSAYCAALAREMGWTDEETEGVRIAGLMHDIGKIAVDKTIINKASPLTTNESRELNSHPVVGYEILSKIKFPWKGIQLMTRNHHEKVDGTGYPDRLRSPDIPVGARMMALVDAFDAMTTDRPYRPRLTFREALNEIRENCGRQFDREVVAPFVSAIRKEVRGEAVPPSILPLLREHLDPASVGGLLEGFPGM